MNQFNREYSQGIPTTSSPEDDWTTKRLEEVYSPDGKADLARLNDDLRRGFIPQEAYSKFIEKHFSENLNRDSLTGLPNKGALYEFLPALKQDLISAHERTGDPGFALISMIDLDNFKFINDHYGHTAGDQALVAFTNHLKNILRDQDKIFRYGGDEFTLIFALDSDSNIPAIEERIKIAISSLVFRYRDQDIAIYATAGFSHASAEQIKNGLTLNEVLVEADDKLIALKQDNKNVAA